MRKIILASASPRRRELLTQAGVTFSIIPAHGEEKRTSDEPGEAVQKLAFDKAASVAEELGECEEKTLVIGSDTVVVFQTAFWASRQMRRMQFILCKSFRTIHIRCIRE